MMRIDSHQHFWRYTPQDHRWISDEMAVLKADFLPEQLLPTLQRHNMQGSILVQACSDIAETQWLLNLAERTEFVRAVTGWVDLTSPQLAEHMEILAHPRLRGLRHQVQDEASPSQWLADAAVNRGVRHIQQQGYVYEILVTHRHLADAAKFAARHDRHPLVLDHFGKPDLHLGAAHWAKQIAPLAAMPHVSCKISGLLTEPRPAGVTLHDLLPYFEVVLEAFGSQRIMFGSDWPVCLLAGCDDTPWALCEQATAALSADEQTAIYGDNACAVYRLQETSNESASAK